MSVLQGAVAPDDEFRSVRNVKGKDAKCWRRPLLLVSKAKIMYYGLSKYAHKFI